MELGSILRNAVTNHGNACAIRHNGHDYSFIDVACEVNELAIQLKEKGIERGDRIAILVSNCPAFPVAYFATLWAGGIVVPINPLLSDTEVIGLLGDCQSKLLISEERFEIRCNGFRDAGVLVEIISANPLGPSEVHNHKRQSNESVRLRLIGLESVKLGESDVSEETAVVLYTSGSTGLPKGVELTHSNLFLNAQSVSEEKFSTDSIQNILGPGHVGLASIPLSHAFCQTNLLNGIWFHGGAITFQSRFEPFETIELMHQNQVTFFAGVPTMYFELVRAGRQTTDFPNSLQFCVCGGAAVSKTLKSEFEQLFGVRIQESYGLTETSPMVSCQAIDRTQKSGCVGKPIRGVQVRVVDDSGNPCLQGEVGEIQIQGHNVFKKYYNNPEETQRAFHEGWFRSGDLGMLDSDGEIRIVDRVKEVINHGGYQIYPREIENVVLSVSNVESASVVGIPDEKYGEQVIVFVVIENSEPENREESKQSVIAEINSGCKKKLAAYKCPKLVFALDELPKGSTGKIDKIQLRALAVQLAQA